MTTMNAVINEDAPAAPAAGQLAPVIAALMHRDPAARPGAAATARMIAAAGPADPAWAAGQPHPADAAWAPEPPSAESSRAAGQPPAAEDYRSGDHVGPMSAPTVADSPQAADQVDWAWPANGPAPAQQAWPANGPAPARQALPVNGLAPAQQRWDQSAAGYRPPRGMLYSAPVAQAGPAAPSAAGPAVPATGGTWRAGEPVGAGGPGRPGVRAASARRHSRTVVAVYAAVAVAAAGLLGGFAVVHFTSSAAPRNGQSGAGTRPGRQGAGRGTQPAAARAGASRAPQVPPAGYSWYTLPAASAGTAAGFRMAVPAGWSTARDGLATYVRNPSGSGFLEVDLTQHTKAGNLAQARWLQMESIRQHRFPGYRRISLRPAAILGSPGAVWTFSWTEQGVGRVIARDYLFTVAAGGGTQSYALYGSAPSAAWPQTAKALTAAVRSFQPLT